MFKPFILVFIAALTFQVHATYEHTKDITFSWRVLRDKPSEFTQDKSHDYGIITLEGNEAVVRLPMPDINFLSCIAATRDLADTELLLYTAFTSGKAVYESAVEFWENLLTCRNESSNVIDVVLCSILELENSGPIWENILNILYTIISGLQNDSLISDLKNCLGFSDELTCLSC